LIHSRAARRLLAPLAACALALGTASTPAIAAPADPASLLLRLPDLGPGYVIARANRSCTPLGSSSPGMRRVFGPGTYRGCWLRFEQAWTAPSSASGPGGVQSLAFAFDSPAGPTTALSRPRALPLPYLDRRDLRIVEPAPPIGDQAVLMRVDRTILGLSFSVGVVGWRSGSVLGMVVAGSLSKGDANVRAAVDLAALQQARIANPTPLRPPVNDDRLVPLDNPTLGVPVMWLGERLPADGRFPALNLWGTGYYPFDLGEHPLVRLIYRTPHLPQTAKVDLWRPRDLRRHLRQPPRPYQCQRRFDVELPGARAWIDATYLRKPRRASGRCRHGSASKTAVAFFDDVGVTIGMSGSVLAPYDSMTGLRTLLRALTERPPATG
jgi:hypothetical protein